MNEPAFPNTFEEIPYYGITIRDYFAAAALTGLINIPEVYSNASGKAVATSAYDIADAMLEAREPKADLSAGLEQYKRDTALFA